MEDFPYGDIEAIRKKVFPGYHDVVDLLQRTRIEMKALQRSANPNNPNPTCNSIIDMRQYKNINAFFKALKVSDVNSSHLIVNDELVIDAKAFLQMTQKDRVTLIEETKKLKTVEDFDTIEISSAASLVCHKYRLYFDKTRRDGILRILTAFQVKSIEELTFGEIQFGELDPNDVDRVIQVFKEAGTIYSEKCSQVISKMADRFKVDNVLDFVAVANYTFRIMREKTISLKNENPKPADKPPSMKDIEYYLDRVVETFIINKNGFQDSIYNTFQTLSSECANQYPEHRLRFKTLMAAANHYDKHWREFPGLDNKPCSPERYFEMAKEMCSNPEENPLWTQDGSSISWQFKHNGALAVRYDNPYKGTAVIATLHKPKN